MAWPVSLATSRGQPRRAVLVQTLCCLQRPHGVLSPVATTKVLCERLAVHDSLHQCLPPHRQTCCAVFLLPDAPGAAVLVDKNRLGLVEKGCRVRLKWSRAVALLQDQCRVEAGFRRLMISGRVVVSAGFPDWSPDPGLRLPSYVFSMRFEVPVREEAEGRSWCLREETEYWSSIIGVVRCRCEVAGEGPVRCERAGGGGLALVGHQRGPPSRRATSGEARLASGRHGNCSRPGENCIGRVAHGSLPEDSAVGVKLGHRRLADGVCLCEGALDEAIALRRPRCNRPTRTPWWRMVITERQAT